MIYGILTESGLEELEFESEEEPIIEYPRTEYNEDELHGKPWINSGMKYGHAGRQLILAGSQAERNKQDKTKDITELPLDMMYRNPREVLKLKGREINSVIKNLQEIERKTYRDDQVILEGVIDYRELAYYYDLNNPEKVHVYLSTENDWYMVFEDREDEISIADFTAMGGLNSEANNSKALVEQAPEVLASFYEVLIKAGRENKQIELNATEDTSYPVLLNLAKKGFFGIREDDLRRWSHDSDIYMHDMILDVNLEKVTEEYKRIIDFMERRNERDAER